MKRLLIVLAVTILPVALAVAIDSKHLESYGMQTYGEWKVGTAGSSVAVNGLPYAWTGRGAGGLCTFQLKYASGTVTTVGGNAPSYTTYVSSSVTLSSTSESSDRFYGIAPNPTFLFDTIASGATCYFRLNYLAPRGANGYMP